MKNVQQEIDERTRLVGQNKFEMMLFRLGKAGASDQSALYGINVFKIRELLDISSVKITPIAGASPLILGVVNVRGQIIQVIDLPAAVGCVPAEMKILMLTEYAGTTQAFAVENVDDIVRLDWSRVKPAEGVSGGSGTVTSIAHLEGENGEATLAQVLDVEQILRTVNGDGKIKVDASEVGGGVQLPEGAIILAADDSGVARMMIEEGLRAMDLPFVMTKSGKEAWERLQELAAVAEKTGKGIRQSVALVLTDLEMPEMDGFTLTKCIKNDSRLKDIPVVIHSSLSGATNESHVRSAGANGYVAKFNPHKLAEALRSALMAA
ncbi:chemotaxis protein [Janthinobacterium sp. 17J80-10]|uniref:chemotaxis protein n=1 Tax=Janthinobacterium sp. 17J80-10 TaxID=2497863 RepID=UPI00100571F6|nr:chemotaxis protein [Janthinobacterium sp. 17J80-10]QAU34531.1 chemotaxis signal transduction protein CheV [Janthinobacterium sp. 17J80-10]